MTQQEYEQKRAELWYEYAAMLRRNCIPIEAFDYIFDRAYALGKREKDADTVIQGWVGRDKDGFISIYQNKPTRDEYDCHGFWHDVDSESHIELPTTSFPDLTWSDDPQECEIIIKRKKNG